jgi:hypothetical protein
MALPETPAFVAFPEFSVSPAVKIDPNFRPEEGGGCLVTGTSVTTPEGSVCVEDLGIGCMVLTTAGARPVRWIGRISHAAENTAGNRAVLPIRIRQDALGDGSPRRDLWVSPEHAMLLDGVLVPAVLLVNGVSILQETSFDNLKYFHLEFDVHAVIYSEGAPSESFVDDGSRAMFDNASEYHSLYPDALPEPAIYCAPRVEDGDELERIRKRLAERAVTLTFVDDDEPRPADRIASEHAGAPPLP